MNKVNSFNELEVYQAAFALQQDLFGLSKHWPKVEDYSLTDQIRRSSGQLGPYRRVLGQAQVSRSLLSKLTDADGELQETLHWLKTAKACEYVSAADNERLIPQLQQIGRLLGSMINCHESFCY